MTEETFEERLLREWAEYRQERNERLHRFFVRILIIFAVLGITSGLTIAYVYYTSGNNRDALCALRHDSERRVQLAEEFLEENPEGIPGVSIDSLRRSTNNAKETVESLSSLKCPPASPLEEITAPTPSVTAEESTVP